MELKHWEGKSLPFQKQLIIYYKLNIREALSFQSPALQKAVVPKTERSNILRVQGPATYTQGPVGRRRKEVSKKSGLESPEDRHKTFREDQQ